MNLNKLILSYMLWPRLYWGPGDGDGSAATGPSADGAAEGGNTAATAAANAAADAAAADDASANAQADAVTAMVSEHSSEPPTSDNAMGVKGSQMAMSAIMGLHAMTMNSVLTALLGPPTGQAMNSPDEAPSTFGTAPGIGTATAGSSGGGHAVETPQGIIASQIQEFVAPKVNVVKPV
jgi:hypothetical protein